MEHKAIIVLGILIVVLLSITLRYYPLPGNIVLGILLVAWAVHAMRKGESP